MVVLVSLLKIWLVLSFQCTKFAVHEKRRQKQKKRVLNSANVETQIMNLNLHALCQKLHNVSFFFSLSFLLCLSFYILRVKRQHSLQINAWRKVKQVFIMFWFCYFFFFIHVSRQSFRAHFFLSGGHSYRQIKAKNKQRRWKGLNNKCFVLFVFVCLKLERCYNQYPVKGRLLLCD